MRTVKQQIAAIKRIIRKDANARGTLLDDDGTMCAIGGLAYYGAKVTKSKLRTNQVGVIYRRVQRAFPILRTVMAREIYRINDDNSRLETRRNKLCQFFDKLIA